MLQTIKTFNQFKLLKKTPRIIEEVKKLVRDYKIHKQFRSSQSLQCFFKLFYSRPSTKKLKSSTF